ncbi:DUF4314 domain-containing protein [Actinoplanes sp. NBC_00393]|uniref:DUF4314 domain-containing protein n=1 Tax=Actinoplanes sp. NBC_00393 TaxID=2975953 RepID=UPI002E1FC052
MKPFATGQRVAAVIDGDIASAFGHGPQGTVDSYDPEQQSLVVNWDDGTQQRLPAQTRLIRLTSSWTPAAGTGLSWQQTLEAARAAGGRAGRHAADWWCRHHIGADATGNPKAAARNALLDLAEDCPEMIDGLPLSASRDEQFAEPPTEADLLALRHGAAVPSGETVTAEQLEQAVDGYTWAFDVALLVHVTDQCLLVASPTGDGRDLSHLHPDRSRVGRYAVFSGEWYLTDDEGPDRYRVGYVGVLERAWNGWAVFACDRTVAEQIVADRAADREADRDSGLSPAEQDRELDQRWGRTYFDGDVLVVDQRIMQGDPEAIERVTARPDGRWSVRSMNLCWDAVDPACCDRIIGDLPASGREQAW